MEEGSGLIGAIIAAAGVGGAWLATILTRRGQKEQSALDKATLHLQAVADRATRAEAGEARERTRAERAEDEIDEQRDEFRKRLADQEQSHRAELIHQAAKCRTETQQLKDALTLITGVVQNEIARTAGLQALNESPEHPHVDIGEWLDEGGSE